MKDPYDKMMEATYGPAKKKRKNRTKASLAKTARKHRQHMNRIKSASRRANRR